MNFDFGAEAVDPFKLNEPKKLAKPQTPRVVKKFTAKYFGFALCKDGDNAKLLSYASRALETVLGAGTKPTKATLEVTSDQVTMTSHTGQRVALIPISELRSFARHKSQKTTKPKLITLMALNRFNDDQRKPYQCFMISTHSTAEADAFCAAVNSAFTYAAECKRLLKDKEEHDAQLAQLPGSPRHVRVGWAS